MNVDSSLGPEIRLAVKQIAADNIHGAAYLARESLKILLQAARNYKGSATGEALKEYLIAVADELAGAQPAMYMISNLLALVLHRLFSQVDPGSIDAARLSGLLEKIVCNEMEQGSKELDYLGEKGAALLAERLAPGGRLLTISSSESVFAILKRLSGADVQIIVAESRPLCEGVKLAEKLARMDFDVCLVTDAMLGIETTGACLALIGADTVTRDGAVINKAGTRLLALAAHADKVPVYCCTQTLKIKPALEPGPEPHTPVQKLRPAEEIISPPAEGVKVRNLYFDRTESYLISGFLTEKGLLHTRDIRRISKRMAELRKKVFAPGK